MKSFQILLLTLTVYWVMCISGGHVYGQEGLQRRVSNLEQRIAAMEEYMQTIKPALGQLSERLLDSVDERFEAIQDKTIVLNPASKKLYRIETNTGAFLISVKKMKKVENGYILYLNLGNPNAASYSDIKVKLKWGKEWNPRLVNPTYKQWRNSLVGAEYTFSGKLESGTWSDIVVDLSPAEHGALDYIECQMEVATVMLTPTSREP